MSLEFALADKRNIGSNSKLNKLPKQFKYMIIVPDGFELESADYATAAALLASLQASIKDAIAARVFLFPPIVKCDELSEETTYDSNQLSVDDVYDGQYRFRLHFSKNMFTHKDIATHYYKNEGRAILVDLENKIFLTELSNGNLSGASIALLKPEKMDISDGSNSTTSPMYLCLQDPADWNSRGRLLDGSSVIRELEPLVDVKIEAAGAFAAATFKVDVSVESDGTPVSGLVLADFKLYATDGVTLQTINAVAEDANIPGRYTITAPGGNDFEDGTLTLRAASALTVSAYENPERLNLTVNIP